jgi:uncharacterized membrane protein YdjX (TVP38/TMEM64 family)
MQRSLSGEPEAEQLDAAVESLGRLPELEPADVEPVRWLALTLLLGSVALGAGLVVVLPGLRHAVSLVLHGDLRGLRHQVLGLGATGVALLVALMLVHAVLFYPAEVVSATAGFVYGFLPGLALAMAGWVASALLSYLVGVLLGRPVLYRLLGPERFARIERSLGRSGVLPLIMVRFVPIMPFSLTGYVAGAVRIPVWRFCWTTFVGYLPLTMLVGYLGSQAESLSANDPRVWAGAAALVAMLGAGHWLRPERGD